MRENLTQAIEDYLKAIYTLSGETGRVGTNQLAERLDVTPASVTGMLQKMAQADPPLVEYQKHHGVTLTPEGEAVALEIIRHHRLLELFLQRALGYTWDEVHAEADRLEHVISEEFEERIAQALGNPATDPHGEPIPTRDFHLPAHSDLHLSELRPGQRAMIQRVEGRNADLLRYLEGVGLLPQAIVEIEDYSPFDDNLSIKVEGSEEPLVLGPRVTRQIYVETL